MMQRQMIGIAQRAVRTAVAPPPPSPTPVETRTEPAASRPDPTTAVIARSELPSEVLVTTN
jgi:hypothetical protein